MSPRSRLLAAAILLVALVLVPKDQPLWFVLPAAILGGVATWCRIPIRSFLRKLLLLESFVIGVSVLALFQPGGWAQFALLFTRGTLALATMTLLSMTTPFSELIEALRGFRVPPLLVETMALMYRYGFVLTEESSRMRRARLCRSFRKGRIQDWRMSASVAGQLFVRSSERAERVYSAMCARGWDLGRD